MPLRALVHIFVDRRCQGHRRRAAVPTFVPGRLEENVVPRFDMTHSRKSLRCFGNKGTYSALELQDADGRLHLDWMLSNF